MRPPLLDLLRRSGFRSLYLAVSVSELGDAFHYIALMWLALMLGGPMGVIAVRLADSVPAIIFGLHGGLVADRWNRRSTMIRADLARGVILVPLAIGGLLGHLRLWELIAAAFILQTATSYFEPAYGALLPSLVRQDEIQAANGVVRATSDAMMIGGWTLAAVLVSILPLSLFFAINAISFFASAGFIRRISAPETRTSTASRIEIKEGFIALRPYPWIAAAIIVIGVAVTISSGTWIAGVPELVRTNLKSGAGGFSVLMVGYAIGALTAGGALSRFQIANKARASLISWTLYFPSYLLLALAPTLSPACAGAAVAGFSESAANILINSAAQEHISSDVLGRVMGLVAMIRRGAHATGLILVAPLFAIATPPTVFVAGAIAIPASGLFGILGARTTRETKSREPEPARRS